MRGNMNGHHPGTWLLNMGIFFMLLAPSAVLANPLKLAPHPITAKPAEMESMTFTRLLFKSPDSFEITVSTGEINIWIIDTLRKFGYNVLGAENLLFGVDNSAKARMLLGGTVSKFVCPRISAAQRNCYMDIQWELFDTRLQQVIYRTGTVAERMIRADVPGTSRDVQRLIFDNMRSLLRRYNFVAHLKKKSATSESSSLPAAHFQRCQTRELSLPAQMNQAIEATVLIRMGNAHGSGFFVSNDGVLLTAGHVAAGLKAVQVTTSGGTELNATVLRVNREQDVALLKVENYESACLPITPVGQHAGNEIFVIGAPLDTQFAFSVSKGIISGSRMVDNTHLLQTDASINPGNSGGPLLGVDGKVLGIVVTKLTGTGVEGVAFATPVQNALVALNLAVSDSTRIPMAVESSVAGNSPIPDFDPADRHQARGQTPYAAGRDTPGNSKYRPEYRRTMAAGAILLVLGLGVFPAVSIAWYSNDAGEVGSIVLAVGGGLAVGGVAMLGKGGRQKKKEQSRTARAHLHLTPFYASHEVGLSLSGRF